MVSLRFWIMPPFNALSDMFCCRGAWGSDVSPCGTEEDDITGILNVFCKHLAHDKCGKSALKAVKLFLNRLMNLNYVHLHHHDLRYKLGLCIYCRGMHPVAHAVKLQDKQQLIKCIYSVFSSITTCFSFHKWPSSGGYL
jgi:hypothetical protein